MDDAVASEVRCSKCNRVAKIVAHGECRRCYDRARYAANQLRAIQGTEKLSQLGKDVLVLTLKQREANGRYCGLDDLLESQGRLSRAELLAGAFECMRTGSASYCFAQIWRKHSMKRAKASTE